MISMHSFILCLTSKLNNCSKDSKTLQPSSVQRRTILGFDGFAYRNHSRESSSRLCMWRKVLGKDVKLFPCKNKLLRLNLPRLPREGGKVLMQFSETFRVWSYVKFSPKQWGISNNLLLETLSSSNILRFPIVGTSCVNWLPSSLRVVRLIRALICGLMLLSLLLRRSNFCKQGKFWQKIPSSSVILLF